MRSVDENKTRDVRFISMCKSQDIGAAQGVADHDIGWLLSGCCERLMQVVCDVETAERTVRFIAPHQSGTAVGARACNSRDLVVHGGPTERAEAVQSGLANDHRGS